VRNRGVYVGVFGVIAERTYDTCSSRVNAVRLAVERAGDMAEDVPLLLPVVIDIRQRPPPAYRIASMKFKGRHGLVGYPLRNSG
jgi:hypothetical protein